MATRAAVTSEAPGKGAMARLALAAAATTVAGIALWATVPKGLIALVACLALVIVAAITYRKPETAIVVLIAASTLDVTGRIAQIGPLRLTLYQGLLAATVLFAIWRVKSARTRLKSTPVDVPLLLFMAVVVISVLGAGEPARAIVALVSLGSSALLVYLVLLLVDTPEALVRVVLGVLAVAVLFSVFTFFEARGAFSIGAPIQNWGAGIRPKVTFKDPNMLGSFLMVASMLALPLLQVAGRRRMKVLVVLAVLLCAFAIFETSSRGALGALGIALLASLTMMRIPFRYKAVIFVLVAIAAFTVLDPAWVVQKVLGAGEDESALARVYMGMSALNMAKDYPFGVGAANYPIVYPWYRDAAVRWNLVESHTMYLTLLVEYGIVGLSLFLWVMWRFISRTWLVAWREQRGMLQSLATGALAAGIGVFAQSFTYSFETSKFLWFSIAVGMAVYTMWKTQPVKEGSQ